MKVKWFPKLINFTEEQMEYLSYIGLKHGLSGSVFIRSILMDRMEGRSGGTTTKYVKETYTKEVIEKIITGTKFEDKRTEVEKQRDIQKVGFRGELERVLDLRKQRMAKAEEQIEMEIEVRS